MAPSGKSNVSKVPVFKPQPEIKPQILGKECQLLEFSTWAKNFCSYIKSPPFDLPEGAINDNIRVCMDSSWYVELEEKGIKNNTTIGELTTLLQKVAMAKFPIHQRRVDVFECKQKTDSKAFLRELTERVRMADWKTFDDQAAICHLFMNGCKSEEAKKACYKILTDNPGGDTKLLMDKLGEIESFPSGGKKEYAKIVKQDDISSPEKTCTDCRRKGHLKADCWGKCAWCGRYGHKTDLCRDKVTETQKQTTKKAQDKKNKKKEKGKKKVKTQAKKIQQYQQRIEDLRNELPESSDDEVDTSEESSDPDDEPTSRVRKVQSAKESRRESRVLAYAENITDNEVIESIKSAKIKKVQDNSGSSHVNAIISKDSAFPSEKMETLLSVMF